MASELHIAPGELWAMDAWELNFWARQLEILVKERERAMRAGQR